MEHSHLQRVQAICICSCNYRQSIEWLQTVRMVCGLAAITADERIPIICGVVFALLAPTCTQMRVCTHHTTQYTAQMQHECKGANRACVSLSSRVPVVVHVPCLVDGTLASAAFDSLRPCSTYCVAQVTQQGLDAPRCLRCP